MKQIIYKRGQSVTEVVLVIGIVTLVLVGMEIYFKRGVSGKIKDMADNWIGKEHKAYQQDTSGLEINESESNYASSSTATLTEGSGGQKTSRTNESAVVTYSSKVEDSGSAD
ncbi:MAG: hypothetical protein WC578_04955 [Candidatus Omnitrophota bacterium]